MKTRKYEHWSPTKCRNRAKKCNSKKEFREKYKSAYKYAIKKNILDEIHSLILNIPKEEVKVRKPSGYWCNLENCANEALKYNTRGEFRENANRVYKNCLKFGWYDDVCKHMVKSRKNAKSIIVPQQINKKIRKPKGYWEIFENVEAVGATCKNRKEFHAKFRGAFNSALRHNWLGSLKYNYIIKTESLKPIIVKEPTIISRPKTQSSDIILKNPIDFIEKKKRGRPKKILTDIIVNNVEKRRRGRPRKNFNIIEDKITTNPILNEPVVENKEHSIIEDTIQEIVIPQQVKQNWLKRFFNKILKF